MANNYEGRRCRIFEASFLLFHSCTVVYQFYEIIFVVEDDGSYEIFFRKVHRGLMVTASLLSCISYYCCSDSIRSTRAKLQKIDYTFESIAAKEYRPPGTRPLGYIIGIYVVSIVLYFYTRCLRGHHFYAYANFVAVLKDALIRTYFVIVNALITLNFTKSIFDGRNRLVRLDNHFNAQVSTGQRIIHINELNDINSIYFQIIDYCDSVRNYYQAPVFLILTSDVFSIIYIILTAFHEFVSKSVSTSAVSFCIADTCVRTVQTVIIISAAEAVVSQIHQWSDTLQRIMIESKIDTKIKEGLKLLLMEMIDKKLVFVIGGFFKLSHETLVAMMGIVSTYLLIMMQFQPLEDVEEGPRIVKSEIIF